jgi:hypothetical protein
MTFSLKPSLESPLLIPLHLHPYSFSISHGPHISPCRRHRLRYRVFSLVSSFCMRSRCLIKCLDLFCTFFFLNCVLCCCFAGILR